MKISVKSKFRGVDVIDKRIKQIKKQRAVLNQIGKQEVVAARDRIRTSKTDPEGRKWSPMARSTRKSRQRRGTLSRGLLFDSGRMMRAIQFTVQRFKLRLSSNSAPYSKYIRQGTNKMPAREFLGWSRDSIQKVKRLFKKHIKG